MSKPDTKEVFLPSKVLELCLKDWDDAPDEELSQAVGETMEHAYLHLRWLLAVRRHRCRLVVVQLKNPQGAELYPHYQLGDLFTLSGWHPERALEEARELLNDSGDGLTFDLPVDDEMLADWAELAREMGIEDDPTDTDAPNTLELLGTAMVLLDDAHDTYVEELGDDFYIATRGLERTMDTLLEDDFGRWSAETVQIIDSAASVGMAQVYLADDSKMAAAPVPRAYQPEVTEDEEDEGDTK